MFSGKSTRLIEIIRKYAYKAKKTIMIKYFGDHRYTDKSEVVTHDLIKYDSIDCKKLRDSFETLKKYDIIGIDEGQFFPDLVEVCEELALLKKTVIIAALNGAKEYINRYLWNYRISYPVRAAYPKHKSTNHKL
jgi:thymidine kinase